LTSDATPTIGTTVTIRGIGGSGKSTLAKAVCHEPAIKKHFPGGFLWISLTPPLASLSSMFKNLCKSLSNENTDGDATYFENLLRSLVSNNPCPLLVVLDNVWSTDDAMPFVDVFSSCKIILTTRKKNINATIHPEKCFDINNMEIDEAAQLLTYHIIEREHLSKSDSTAINSLANDLYCWPLLLNLVHGQLYVHCIEWGESPTNAISKVQKKLFDKGLTAFDDSESCNQDKAVKASITASLELLQDDEEKLLFTIISSMGIGSCVAKKTLYDVTKLNTDEFSKQTIALWSHGLISFNSVTLPILFDVQSNETIPCIEIHEIVAQYIVDEMPYNFCKFIKQVDIRSDMNIIYNDEMMEFIQKNEDDSDIYAKFTSLAFFLQSYIDEIIMPFLIRTCAVCIRVLHINFQDFLNTLIENHTEILETHSMLKLFRDTQPIPVKSTYRAIKHNCKTLQTLLASNRHDEALLWIDDYWKTHPLKATIDYTSQFVKGLKKECNQNSEIVEELDAYVAKFDSDYIHMMELLIKFRRDIIQLVVSEFSEASITCIDKTVEEFTNVIDMPALPFVLSDILKHTQNV